MKSNNPRRGWDEGAAAVEGAISFSVLLLLILGIIEFATALYSWNAMQFAVQQAGRYAMVNYTNCNNSCAENAMQAILTTATACTIPTAGQICVKATTNPGTPSTMTLTASYRFNFIALAGPFTMIAQGIFPLD